MDNKKLEFTDKYGGKFVKLVASDDTLSVEGLIIADREEEDDEEVVEEAEEEVEEEVEEVIESSNNSCIDLSVDDYNLSI